MALKDLWLPYKIVEVINVFKDEKWHCHILIEEEDISVVKDGTCYEYTKDLPDDMKINDMPAHTFYGYVAKEPDEVGSDEE